jgi:hypothetical protein
LIQIGKKTNDQVDLIGLRIVNNLLQTK